ncbi:cupin domain-containing protein [Hymenobacter taeanensis]|uniref:Cupin domain-containing protein n=1 Tax=Hymenobacter taeanensis TaxID=2735321 RepID=A0A6M6BJ02_9BACT|nr:MULTISPECIES: cupin domain-containing protein [Hymenobacter]QJX48002.1 cupin domain-containing protein [Hymenobacter taeanensis]UOQ82550.1 cupin domain-containing protein [Hymenobacter sp. 5414T-23]
MAASADQHFLTNESQQWETVGEGVRRSLLAYGPDLMLVKVAFETGAVGAPHRHVHAQITYVESGVFRCLVGEEERVLRAGEGFHAPSNLWHGVVCEEAGVLLDSFSPMREDFV